MCHACTSIFHPFNRKHLAINNNIFFDKTGLEFFFYSAHLDLLKVEDLLAGLFVSLLAALLGRGGPGWSCVWPWVAPALVVTVGAVMAVSAVVTVCTMAWKDGDNVAITQ